MQKAGDVCESCRERWERKKKEPKVLRSLNDALHKDTKVVACPYCDGTTLETFKSNTSK